MEGEPNMNMNMNMESFPFPFAHYNMHVPNYNSFPDVQYNCLNGGGSSGDHISMSSWTLNNNVDMGASGGISFALPAGSSPANMALSPARRLVHGPAWSIEWTPHEQAILNRGLQQFANDPVITKYAKIAARLQNKTVRDVAMRCQWMKKREHEGRQDLHFRRTIRDRKERMSSCSSLGSRYQHHTQTAASTTSQPLIFNPHINQNDPISLEVLRLLEENNRALEQISRNLEQGQVQNGALFSHVGSNIETIIFGINATDSSLRRMPPVPVAINGDLFRAMLPSFSSMASTSSSSLNLSEVSRRQSSC